MSMSFCADNWSRWAATWLMGSQCCFKSSFSSATPPRLQPHQNMGVEVRRGPSLLATTVPILIMLLHAHICRAVSPVRGNSSTSGCCNGDQEEWLVGDIAPEEEFLMGSETNRMLQASHPSKNTVYKALIGKKPGAPCGQYKSYGSCLPRGNKRVSKTGHCGTYTRGCYH
uniref:Uncharacterized protein n=1 Tax=Vitis vinifera TaxID=29760 RepID=F6HWM9_VITVI